MQTAEGLKTFCYPSVGLVTKTVIALRAAPVHGDWAKPQCPCMAIACGFLAMPMFYNPYSASIVGIFPSFFPSAVSIAVICLPPTSDH